jgi:hypothetical protein
MVCLSKQSLPRIDSVKSYVESIRDAKSSSIAFHYKVFSKRRSGSPEMTLIATVWSPEGFAIAADGFEMYTDSGKSNEDVQKIFSTPFVNETGFAWAWVGHVGVEFVSGRRCDLKEITQRVMEGLPANAYLESPEDYFQRISLQIFYELPTDVDLSRLPAVDNVVIFVGYLAGKPLWREIVFPQKGEFFPPTVVEPKHSLRDFYPFAGSPTIDRQINNDGILRQPLDLLEAVSSVRAYAEMCVGSREKVKDCQNFGGTIHIATVTEKGFDWIIEPKNLKK